MVNRRIGNDPRAKIQATGSSYGWQRGSRPILGDDGKVRETRAELA